MDNLKKCSKCGVVKPLDDFFKERRKKDGRRPICKACQEPHLAAYRKSPEGWALIAWHSLNRRINKRTEKTYCYHGLSVEISKKDFVEWAMKEYKKFIESYPGSTPSIDRINSEQGYVISNLQIIDSKLNSSRALKSPRISNIKKMANDPEKFAAAIAKLIRHQCNIHGIPISKIIERLL